MRGSTGGSQGISGGSNGALGGNLLMYGESHATSANDIWFRTGSSIKLAWDNSADSWGFQNNDLIGLGNVTMNSDEFSRDIATGVLAISGGSGPSNGAVTRMFGGGHATNANDWQVLAAGGGTKLHYDNSAAKWNFQGIDVVGVRDLEMNFGNIRRNHEASLLMLNGGSDENSGGGLRLYGSTHATQANDIELRTDTAIRLSWDQSASNWDFQGHALAGIGNVTMSGTQMFRSNDTSQLFISGGGSVTQGSNIVLHGSAATNAQDILLRTGSTTRLQWNQSATLWNYSGTRATGMYSLSLGNSSGNFNLSGGSSSTEGANLYLYAENHATQARDIIFRTDGTQVLAYDSSQGKWAKPWGATAWCSFL